MVKNILVIRRDNIGDLVCTTSLFESLRHLFPHATICAYVNTMNAPVLTGNPYIDRVFTYTKSKHRQPGQSLFGLYWQRLCTLIEIKKQRFDTVILANPRPCYHSLKVAKTVGAQRIIGAAIDGEKAITHPFNPDDFFGAHQVEQVHSYLRVFSEPLPVIPPNRVFIQDSSLETVRTRLPNLSPDKAIIGIHISVRRPKSRWSVEKYAELIHLISQHNPQMQFLLFWAPAKADDIRDVGDEKRATQLMELCANLPVYPLPTENVEVLKAGLSLCESVICSDGGPMHLAAALDKKLLVFFGDTSIEHWHPWCQCYQILKPHNAVSESISSQQAFESYLKLQHD